MLLTAVAASLLLLTAIKTVGGNSEVTDYEKITKILGGEEKLKRETKHPWGTEYVFTFPLGKTFGEYESKKQALENGLVKDIEMSFDGWITIKVYDLPFTSHEDYTWEGENNWIVPVGFYRDKSLASLNFEHTPHVVLGGGTRYGKSNMLHVFIVSLLRNKPLDVEFYFIDLKGGVELSRYSSLKQCKGVALEPEDAAKLLRKAYKQMRKAQMKPKKGKKSFIIIDEVGELNPSEAVSKEEKALKLECQKYMSQISRLGAGLNFHQILSTQYPTGDVIPRQCKQNSDSKICFRVQSSIASRVVLDESGAEELPAIKGRGIFQYGADRYTVQVPYISNDLISEECEKHQREEHTYEDAIKTTEQPSGEDSFIIEETRFS